MKRKYVLGGFVLPLRVERGTRGAIVVDAKGRTVKRFKSVTNALAMRKRICWSE